MLTPIPSINGLEWERKRERKMERVGGSERERGREREKERE